MELHIQSLHDNNTVKEIPANEKCPPQPYTSNAKSSPNHASDPPGGIPGLPRNIIGDLIITDNTADSQQDNPQPCLPNASELGLDLGFVESDDE